MAFTKEILTTFLLGLLLALVTESCTPVQPNGSRSPLPSRPAEAVSAPGPVLSSAESGRVQVGVASWYGPGFHGRLTANGEVYNQYELTAAHRTLSLGTTAMVTNLETNQSVEVRINDRGPFVDGRVLDLSYAAGRAIGLIDPGTARVRIEVVGSSPSGSFAAIYAVQVGSFADPEKAAFLRSRLTNRYSDVYVSPLQASLLRYYQVRLGPFSLRAEAERRAVEVARLGLRVIIVEETILAQ
jgi:rare lipoprotein A